MRVPLVTSTEMGYWPASMAAGALAVTVTGVVAPAFTIALAAWLSELTWDVMVQPSGPVATPVNVRSSDVSLWSVRLKEKVVVDGPLREGKSVVRLTSPAAFGVTRMSSGSVSVAAPALATTSMRWVAAAASAGTVTSRRTVAAVVPLVWTPSTMNPPPKSDAVHDAGAPLTERSTRADVSVLIERSKLTFVPGATATPG